MAAFYREGNTVLIGLEETVVDFEGNKTATASFKLSKDYSQAESIKVFVWTDYMEPFMKSRLNKISTISIIE